MIRIYNYGLTMIVLAALSCGRSIKTTSGPEFPGGYDSLQKYIRDKLNWKEPQDTIESNAFVFFTVKADGELTDIQMVPVCESCDYAAIQLVKEMPKWIPAQKNGKTVDSKTSIVILFQSSYLK